ncbi:hypothetical protein D3C78_1266750 [compost metagenome]
MLSRDKDKPPVSWSAVTTTDVFPFFLANSMATLNAASKSSASCTMVGRSLACPAWSILPPSIIMAKPFLFVDKISSALDVIAARLGVSALRSGT